MLGIGRKLCIVLSWGVAGLLAAAFLSPLRQMSPPDFPSYYFAGRMVVTGEVSQLYKKEAYDRRWAELQAQGEPIERHHPNYFIRPAFAAFLCAPLGLLSYRTAWMLALCANCVVLGLAVWKLPNWFGGGSGFGLWRPWLAAYMPFLWSIGYGQDTVLLTLLVGYSLHLLADRQEARAGIALGVCAVKLHLVWGLPLVLLFERRYRAVAAFLGTALVLATVSLLAVGSGGMVDWVRLILYENTDFAPASMFNVRALWIAFGPVAGLVAVAIVLVGVATIFWRGTQSQKVSAAILAGLLLSPHTYNQDASLAALLPFLHPVAAVRLAVLVPWPFFDPLKDQRNLLWVGLAVIYLAFVCTKLLRSSKAVPTRAGSALGEPALNSRA